MKKNLYELLIKDLIKSRADNPADLSLVKKKIAEKYKIPYLKNTSILKVYHKLLKDKKIRENKILERSLQIRKVRSLSGVVVVSVLTSPCTFPAYGKGAEQGLSCPYHCLYCPDQKGMPKSYLDNEPAVMRAVLNNFDPFRQVKTRLKSLEATGHSTDKIELIVIGGTWSYLPKKYQEWFIKRCFDACNKYGSPKIPRSPRATGMAAKGLATENLNDAQKINEKAKHRIIGITIETRPDFINIEEIKQLRKLGATRVELGVQSVYDDILKLNRRGHGIKEVIQATKLLKDAGFKICYHMMPNLPGSNLKKDEKMFEEIFKNPDFQPDFLKIYPCVVVKEAPLYKLWREGKYKPYTDKQLINLLKNVKEKIPVYCRIIRIIRDIPSSRISGGSKISNLREVVLREMKKEGKDCKCIRCREVKQDYDPKAKLKLFRKNYNASDGKEIFLSYEDKNREHLYSLLRLRIPSFALRAMEDRAQLPVLQDSAIIREVHTYGQAVPIEEKIKIAPQHKGLGRKLMKEAEKIAKKSAIKRIAVISGVGTREYYKKLGYKLKDSYMIKEI